MNKILLTVAFLLALGGGMMVEAAEIAPGVIAHQDLFNTSMKDDVACYRIPALVTAPNGDLVAAIDERVPSCSDLGKSKNINIVIRRSSDNGDTWSAIETVVDYEDGKGASDPSMIVDKETGDLFLFYNYMDHNTEPGVYYLHVMRSSDNGKSWGDAEDITSQITKPEWKKDFKFITSGRGIQARSGMLLHTMVNIQSGLHLFGSKDHGKTWFFIDTPITPGDESKVVELADGRWMINSRVRGSGLRYVHLSSDEGKSWETAPDPALIDPACNASIIRYTSIEDGYDKNRLLFSNAKTKDKRRNMTVRISYDEGKTWSDDKTIYTGGSAYSTLTVLENGEIGLLFEKDSHRENVFVRFTLEWLTDGKDTIEAYKSKKEILMSESEQIISNLTKEDEAYLSERRTLIEEYLGDENAKHKYLSSEGKLGLLHALLDQNIFKPSQTFELQCMGVVFGDVLVQEMNMHWVMVADDLGHDPAVQLGNTSIIIFPLTMISKRIERGEQVDVFALFNGLAAQIEGIVDDVDKSQ